jgi:cob(I)alamin adenosyltransferase
VASLQLSRAVCRRVERALVALAEAESVNPMTAQYINRLSDLLFIVARAQSQAEGGGEVYWNSRYSRLNRGD